MSASISRQRCPNHSLDAAHLGPGWELRVRGRVVARVIPERQGWRVTNRQTAAERLIDSLSEAEALADRIARLAASP